MPKLVAAHKGFALPGFDQRAASPRDIGPAARQYPDMNFVVYHSGYDGEDAAAVPGGRRRELCRPWRELASSRRCARTAGTLHASVPAGLEHGNVPNVYAEIGSMWRERDARPRPGRAPAGQADHPRGSPAGLLGHRQPVVRLAAVGDRGPARPSGCRTRPGSSTTCPTAWTATRSTPGATRCPGHSYLSSHPHVKGWPKDGKAHPERTIRNRSSVATPRRIYQVDADAQRKAIACDASRPSVTPT